MKALIYQRQAEVQEAAMGHQLQALGTPIGDMVAMGATQAVLELIYQVMPVLL